MMKNIIAPLALAILVTGCATKDFGRIQPLGSLATMNCAQLDAEQDRATQFRANIDEKDDWDARTLVASTLLDFGIGNMQEKKKALASADAHEKKIAEARRVNGC